MAVQFKVPKSVPRSISVIDEFLGVDFTNSSAAIDIRRSPNGQNMIRSVPGKVRKSLGWTTQKTYTDEKINGCHFLRGESGYLIHAGTKLYFGDTVIYSGMNDARSMSWEFNKKLYIVDGKAMIVVQKSGQSYTAASVSASAYIPTLTISKDPSGGGTAYEDLNLLQPGFTESFLGQAGVSEYSLSFGGLDATEVTAEVMDANGDWVDLVENEDFSVDRATGTVSFNDPPGVSPVTGEDNVKITAYRTVEGYASRVNKCKIGVLYGVNGGNDRLFLTGNPDYINYDWYSESYMPSYFPDTNYSKLGSDASAIIGYSKINNYLATHKDDFERDQNIIIRGSATVDDKVVFRVTNALQGCGAVAPYSFGYIANEPLFLTTQGVFAVTAQDVTGDKYSQNRSFYLNGKLLNEQHLEDAYACVYKDMYLLCINNVVYVLDGLQSVVSDKAMPYATRQFCGFYRTNVPANCMWVKDGELWFGSLDGKVAKFATDEDSLTSYNDDGEPIEAIWETPDIEGKLFYKNKTLRYLAVKFDAALKTSAKIYGKGREGWELLKEDESTGSSFTFSTLKFSALRFGGEMTQLISTVKAKIKKVDHFQLKVQNSELNEPFGLFEIGFEFVENGNFKT